MSNRPEPGFPDMRFLADLIEINHEITAILDLDLLLSKIAELTERFVSYQVFAILLVDETKQELYYRFALGHPDDVVDSLRVPIGEGIIGTAAAERRPVVVDDVSKDPRYIDVVKTTRSELAVPLISKNKVLGVLDIESPEIGYFHEDQVRMLHLLGSQIAIAIENANVYESELRNRQLLTLLYDISLEMASTLDVDELIDKIAEAVKSTIDYHIFSILLVDEQRRRLRPRIVFRLNTQAFEKYDVPMGKGLVGEAALENKAVRVGDVSGDERYINVHSETVSEMVIPLVSKGQVIGVLDLESRKKDYFTDYHQRLLMTLASRISSALVNAELYEKVVADEKRLDDELAIAREIQRQLLPNVIPSFGALEMAVSFIPVAHLGGDLYDMIRFDDGRVAITVGDVSGKGAPAALYGALSSGVIRTRATQKYLPARMLELVNQSLQQRPIATQYIALVYSVYDPETRQITIANSGLPYPIRIREGSCGFLDLAGIPLGLFPDSKYQEQTITLNEGEILVFYTDGFVEMTDEDGNEFGLERLAQLVRDLRDKTPRQIVAGIDDQIREFAGCCPSQDDRTLFVMKMGKP